MRNLFYIAILTFSVNSFAQVKKCNDFKNGTFKYAHKDYGELVTVRMDTLQTDSYPISGDQTKSRIKWLSGCKYEMEFIEVNKSYLQSLIGVKYTVEIIRINGKKITCRTNNKGEIIETEMIKVD